MSESRYVLNTVPGWLTHPSSVHFGVMWCILNGSRTPNWNRGSPSRI